MSERALFLHFLSDDDSISAECGCSLSRVHEGPMQGAHFRFCHKHKAADDLLAALKGLRDDLQTRLDMATEGATEADSLVLAEDANRSWRSWLFDVMSTHGDIARAAITKAHFKMGD